MLYLRKPRHRTSSEEVTLPLLPQRVMEHSTTVTIPQTTRTMTSSQRESKHKGIKRPCTVHLLIWPWRDSDVRRSMIFDEAPLPDGWRREFDAKTEHTFYVDTKAKPPRSIWVHPYEVRTRTSVAINHSLHKLISMFLLPGCT